VKSEAGRREPCGALASARASEVAREIKNHRPRALHFAGQALLKNVFFDLALNKRF
jgi:hypothetical protein